MDTLTASPALDRVIDARANLDAALTEIACRITAAVDLIDQAIDTGNAFTLASARGILIDLTRSYYNHPDRREA